ncbi:MAG: class I SAM-dependent methyltransferase [Chloroflexi bacterium]|nr:class I SAM-dependent methyltransferase [Chloroflexota bacterium]
MANDYQRFRDSSKQVAYRRYEDFKRLEFIIKALKESFSGKDIKGLDAGCGKGNVTIPLASLGYRMTGFDISQKEIKIARDKMVSQESPLFFVGDVEKPGLRDGVFDFAICSEVLEHIHHPETALGHISRVLKKNGVLVATVPNGFGPYSLLRDQLRNKVVARVYPRIGVSAHVQYYTLRRISGMIRKAGFEVIKVGHSDFISFLPVLAGSDKVCYVDCKLADRLPSLLVSGYYLWCRKR